SRWRGRNGNSADRDWRVCPCLCVLDFWSFALDHPDLRDFRYPDDQGDQADDRARDYRGVVACSCRDAINGALERAPRAPFRAARTPPYQFRRPVDVPMGRDHLHLDYLPDLLSLHVFQVLAGRFLVPVLDQHGSNGYLHTRRLAPD